MGASYKKDKSTNQIITDSIVFDFDKDNPYEQLWFFQYTHHKNKAPNVLFEFYGLYFRRDIPEAERSNFSSIMKATARKKDGLEPGKYTPLESYEPVKKMIDIGSANFTKFSQVVSDRDIKFFLSKITNTIIMESSTSMVADIATSVEENVKDYGFGIPSTKNSEITRKNYFKKKTNSQVAKDILADPFNIILGTNWEKKTLFKNYTIKDLEDVANTYPASKLEELDPNVKVYDRRLIANIKWALTNINSNNIFSFARMDVGIPLYKAENIKGYEFDGELAPLSNVDTFKNFFNAQEHLKGIKNCLLIDDNKRTANTQNAIHSLLPALNKINPQIKFGWYFLYYVGAS